MPQEPTKKPQPKRPAIAAVVSRYNPSITDSLLAAARGAFAAAGHDPALLAVFDAPGSFELAFLSHQAAATGRYDGVLALGCVIKGETRHDEHIASAVARGIADASIRTGIPIAFGVITAENADQARARAGGAKGNKGAEAMTALLHTIDAARAIREGAPAAATPRLPDKAAQARAETRPQGGN